jgi:hypothetical protein
MHDRIINCIKRHSTVRKQIAKRERRVDTKQPTNRCIHTGTQTGDGACIRVHAGVVIYTMICMANCVWAFYLLAFSQTGSACHGAQSHFLSLSATSAGRFDCNVGTAPSYMGACHQHPPCAGASPFALASYIASTDQLTRQWLPFLFS